MLLNTILGTKLTLSSLLICSITSIILELLVALTHKLTSKYNKNFLITITIIPSNMYDNNNLFMKKTFLI